MAVLELFVVELRVKDRAPIEEWYRLHFGMQLLLEDRAGDYSLLRSGTMRVAIKGGRDEAVSGSTALMFRADGLSLVREQLIAQGIEVSEIEESREGYRTVRLADPAGNPIQIFEMIFGSREEERVRSTEERNSEDTARGLP